MNYDSWKLSNPYDENKGSEYVTSCCGSEYDEDVMTCGDCGSFEMKTLSKGDEFWSVCSECDSIENEYHTDYVCHECNEECSVVPLWEYQQDQRDNYYEDMQDDD